MEKKSNAIDYNYYITDTGSVSNLVHKNVSSWFTRKFKSSKQA